MDLADQYLEFGRRADKAAATRDWLVMAFVGAARKRHDFATARLLALRPGVLASAAPAAADPPGDAPRAPALSLDEFAAAHDPDGFYTEKELLELFAAHQAAAAALRRQRRACARSKWPRSMRSRAYWSRIPAPNTRCWAGSTRRSRCAWPTLAW
ncbi:hypothetical protein [Burkholderia alba]|uniref:hypothetical protein n=1 Tax=Burkholderia alba TaxID=2683677 RepID=UPI002B056F4E|nr:hypothetical protein [Burkholderia alba]